VIETNFFGCVYGARAALPLFREQGRGVLVNVSSVVAVLAQPYTSAYSASKQAIRSLGASLRQELALEGASEIHVCTVLPATIDTPLFQHAANYTGRAVRAMSPVYSADRAARAIVSLASTPQREVFVGNAGRLLNLQRTLTPAAAERAYATLVDTQHLSAEVPAQPTPGNLYAPMPEGTGVSGGWRNGGVMRAVGSGLAMAVPAAAGYLLWRRSRQQQRKEDRFEVRTVRVPVREAPHATGLMDPTLRPETPKIRP
jgi:NAD(P)-dependent dehydrogenase (short-subunit alcohol dehydrogenase family)